MNPTLSEQIVAAARELLKELADRNTWMTHPAEAATRRLDELLKQAG